MNKSSARIRIANKKRAFLTILTIAVLFSVLCFGSVSSKMVESNECRVVSHTVVRGETLWEIADRYNCSNMDIREYIYEIRQANDLSESSIYPDDTLRIPIFEK